MLPGINPKDMQKAMKKLGIKQQEIQANQVIIKTDEKEIIVDNPSVVQVNMMGQETFQISGQIKEQPIAKFNEDDIKTVMEQANVDYDKAKQALEKKGDIAEAILSLQA